MNRLIHRQRGLTLIEIMVALTISAILLAGVLQILIGSQQTYRSLEANARVQESGRFATAFLAEDLRMAGYMGCFSQDIGEAENILNDPDAFDWDLSRPIAGYRIDANGTWSPPRPAELATLPALPDTDVIVMRGMANDGTYISKDQPNNAGIFVTPEGNNIQIGEIIMLTDCSKASIAQITHIQQTAGGTRVRLVHSGDSSSEINPGNSTPIMSNSYSMDAEIARLQSVVYFVGENEQEKPALYRRNFIGGPISSAAAEAAARQELVEDIESMRVRFGLDTSNDGHADEYRTPDDVPVADIERIVSARVSLLVRSDDRITTSPQGYFFDGTRFDSEDVDDLRVRRAFTVTAKLRNRGAR